ncbi:hypothetical protein CEP53_012564, partial [Fusarium sp. AF-6]
MPPSDLKTPLMSYQKATLSFIRQRENPEYCQQVMRELRFHIPIPQVGQRRPIYGNGWNIGGRNGPGQNAHNVGINCDISPRSGGFPKGGYRRRGGPVDRSSDQRNAGGRDVHS